MVASGLDRRSKGRAIQKRARYGLRQRVCPLASHVPDADAARLPPQKGRDWPHIAVLWLAGRVLATAHRLSTSVVRRRLMGAEAA